MGREEQPRADTLKDLVGQRSRESRHELKVANLGDWLLTGPPAHETEIGVRGKTVGLVKLNPVPVSQLYNLPTSIVVRYEGRNKGPALISAHDG